MIKQRKNITVRSVPSLKSRLINHDIFLLGFQADEGLKIKVEPGLFEYKRWHAAKGLAPFMTPAELHNAGFNVDLE